jgi:thiosulfate dehydrogenase
MMNQRDRVEGIARAIIHLKNLFLFVLVVVIITPLTFLFGDRLYKAIQKEFHTRFHAISEKEDEAVVFWKAPDLVSISDEEQKARIVYGKELIAHTARYLGPKGSVMQISNGMNCQNCHLEAGTKIFGNNYSAVASTYPKFRARSGTTEDIYKRVNDCIERSLNGKALDTMSREMQAIKAYILFLGSEVEKGIKPDGAGLKEITWLERAADPEKGRGVYITKCVSCHMPDGQGQPLADGTGYLYPPLWGPASYNDGAGLYRLSNFAKFARYNMPQGATHKNAMLTDEEAWDVAAYVNSQPRPHLEVPGDWPDITKKPVDHPFGPYADSFSESRHKYGPYQQILALQKSTITSAQK